MIAPIDKINWVKPTPNYDVIDRATHGMIDVNGDGKVCKDEWNRSGRCDDAFQLFDANGDGAVSEDEFAQTRKYEREFNSKDRNGDGVLSRLEYQGIKYFGAIGGGLIKGLEKGEGAVKDLALRCMPPMIRDRFSSYDTNRDGQVSKEEFVKGRRNEERVWHRPDWILERPMYKGEALKSAANN